MGRMRKNIIFLLAIFLIGGWVAASSENSEKLSFAADTPRISSDELFRRIIDTSNQIRDLSAKIDFDLKLHNLGLSFNISGDYYYKQPDKVHLDFKSLPPFLASRQDEIVNHTTLITELLKNPVQNFNGRILAEIPAFQVNCYLVELIPKTKQNITKVFLWVNADDYTIPQTILEFDDGSNVTERKTYMEMDHMWVVSKAETMIDSPSVQANVFTTFTGYQINKGLPDSLFERTQAHESAVYYR